MTDRALVEPTDRTGQPERGAASRSPRAVPVVAAALVLVVVALTWPAPAEGSWVLAVVAGVVTGVVVGPFLAYEVQRWIGWRVVVPLLVGQVTSPRRIRREPAACGQCGRSVGVLADRAQSWTWRGGRCRGCGTRVPAWVVAVEVAAGVGVALAAWRLGWSWRLAVAVPFVLGLVAITAVDVVHQRIPTRFVAVTAAACVVVGVPATLAADAGGALAAAWAGAAAYGGFLTVLYLVSSNGLGGGDVRLAWLVGGVVGALTWTSDQGAGGAVPHVLTTAVVAALIGLATHLAVALAGRRTRTLPFAPAMTTAALLVGLLAQVA